MCGKAFIQFDGAEDEKLGKAPARTASFQEYVKNLLTNENENVNF